MKRALFLAFEFLAAALPCPATAVTEPADGGGRELDDFKAAQMDALRPGLKSYPATDGSVWSRTWVRMVRASELAAGEWWVTGPGLIRRSGNRRQAQ